jgi:hypothetical protein
VSYPSGERCTQEEGHATYHIDEYGNEWWKYEPAMYTKKEEGKSSLSPRCTVMNHDSGNRCTQDAGHVTYHVDEDGNSWRRLSSEAHARGPEYYKVNGMQPWDVIDAFELDYYMGTALKYILRAGRKGSKLEDLTKAEHFIQKAIERENDT